MAYDLEEQEQFDAFKAWWAKYGTLIMGVVAAAMLTWGGWSAWKAYQSHQASQAMGYYEALEDASRSDGADSAARVKAAANTLRSDFPESGYAGRGALVAAEALLEQNDVDGAREQLSWLAAQNGQTSLRPLAKLRLAGILLDEKKYDEALAQLDSPPTAFVALYADRRGDVLAEQGKTAEARAAWSEAVKNLGPADPMTQVVQLKLDALSGD